MKATRDIIFYGHHNGFHLYHLEIILGIESYFLITILETKEANNAIIINVPTSKIYIYRYCAEINNIQRYIVLYYASSFG